MGTLRTTEENVYLFSMPVQRTIPYSEGIFSITFTCYNWLPLLEQVNGYDLIYNWFNVLKANGHHIVGYVIMPNHVHAIIGFRNTGVAINTIVGNGKRFIGYKIINRLKAKEEHETLMQLQNGVAAKRKEQKQLHAVWEHSFDWKYCTDERFVLQKLDYFHANPCKGKWNLCASPVDYKHSSAKFYATGEQGIYPVTSYGQVMDVDLTRKNSSP